MAGIYIHIPFCKTRCLYCDFFSSTNRKIKDNYVAALCEELAERKDYLQGEPVETVYFGGGTPSQLPAADFEKIFEALRINGFMGGADQVHPNGKTMEITIEANPDDLNAGYIDLLRQFSFNRISIGIQSFNDEELQFLNRRHKAFKAFEALKGLKGLKADPTKTFNNISLDLMYGLPNQTLATWKDSIQQTVDLNIQHISAYHLIYEEDTPLHNLLKQNKIQSVSEELSIEMFDILIDTLTAAGYEHYEISNFAKPGFRSRHNASYWDGTPYLGIGAAAHSFDGKSRQWNARSINYRNLPVEKEILSEKDRFNDFILTRLRTMQGIHLNELIQKFGEKQQNDCLQRAQKYLNNKLLEIKDNYLRLTRSGIFVSDGIMCDLMI